MEQTLLIDEVSKLINQASERAGAGFPNQARARLVKLRELLNDQPELEAGGACKLRGTFELPSNERLKEGDEKPREKAE